jgi:hypothetical protein
VVATLSKTTYKTAEGCKLDGFDSSWVLNTWFCG